MHLYELTETGKSLQEFADAAANDDNSDLGDVIAEAFALLEGEIETKIDSCCSILAEWEGDAASCKVQEQRLAKLRKSAENKARALKSRMLEMMQETEHRKIKGALFTASIRKPSKIVHIIDAAFLADDYFNYPPPTPNKPAIAAAIKSGVAVVGAELVDGKESITIK